MNYDKTIEIVHRDFDNSIIPALQDYIKIDKKYRNIKDIIKNQNLPFKFILKNFDKNEIDLIEEYSKNLKNQNNFKRILSKIIDEKYTISIYLSNNGKNNFIDFNKYEIKNIPNLNYEINDDLISIEDCFEAFRQEVELNDDWYCNLCKKISKIRIFLFIKNIYNLFKKIY